MFARSYQSIQMCPVLRVCEVVALCVKVVQIVPTFEPYVNAPQIFSNASLLHKSTNLDQMWRLQCALWVANVV